MGKTIIGWTRQVREVAEELKNTGSYRVKEEYIRKKNDTIADYYLELYKWYTQESRKYLDIPEDMYYPIWFSLTESFRLQQTDGTVIIKAAIPAEKVLIIDSEKWEYRGNLMYVPADKTDREKFEQELARYGIADETALADTAKGNYYPLLKKKVLDSWNRIFTIPPASPEKGFATAWELEKEWVMEIVYGEDK